MCLFYQAACAGQRQSPDGHPWSWDPNRQVRGRRYMSFSSYSFGIRICDRFTMKRRSHELSKLIWLCLSSIFSVSFHISHSFCYVFLLCLKVLELWPFVIVAWYISMSGIGVLRLKAGQPFRLLTDYSVKGENLRWCWKLMQERWCFLVICGDISWFSFMIYGELCQKLNITPRLTK